LYTFVDIFQDVILRNSQKIANSSDIVNSLS
jgi:hypothetical protein